MQIKQDPITGLYCREDGAVLMPPANNKFPQFRWTFGANHGGGYRTVWHRGKKYFVHQIICRAFRGLAPSDKPEVDHIDRNPSNNASSNLRWASRSENCDNRGCVDQALEKYGVRQCEDKKAYDKAYNKAYRAKMKAQGLALRKGPDGRRGWFPCIRTQKSA